jgi:hypothetical protein
MSRPALLVLLAVVAAACGGGSGTPDGAPIDADPAAPDADRPDAAIPREVVTATQPMVPGEIIEGLFTGGPDDFAVIHLEAPAMELDWNIHGHENGGTQTVYEELNKMSADYTFTPSSETDWWLLLRNSGPTDMDIEVRLELHGDMQWEWQ